MRLENQLHIERMQKHMERSERVDPWTNGLLFMLLAIIRSPSLSAVNHPPSLPRNPHGGALV